MGGVHGDGYHSVMAYEDIPTTLAMAVVLRGGALLAAGVDRDRPGAEAEVRAAMVSSAALPLRRVVKAPWGIVAGTAPPDVVAALRRLLHRSPAPSPDDLLPFSGQTEEGGGPHANWLFSYEPPEPCRPPAWAGAAASGSGCTDAPVLVYRSSAHGPLPVSWGAVLLPEALDAEIGREGTLRLHAAVADDRDPHARFTAVLAAFAWFAERVPGLGTEVDVGFHESGHLYSVDRFAL